ncbi:MAG: hypothetical protein HN975_02305 [Anaerolineae bacterium]|jgi:hypothetical protein|nr:hypothetical protein [Anaerolineae bacterium]
MLRNKADQNDLYRLSEDERELIWNSLSAAQKKNYLKRKKAFDEKTEKESQVQEKASPDYAFPDFPIRYSERAHRYKITFFDENENPLKRLFRGDLEGIRSYIKKEILCKPKYAKAKIQITQTNQLVEFYPQSQKTSNIS